MPGCFAPLVCLTSSVPKGLSDYLGSTAMDHHAERPNWFTGGQRQKVTIGTKSLQAKQSFQRNALSLPVVSFAPLRDRCARGARQRNQNITVTQANICSIHLP
eukprot:6455430-Amphidinium_carterae.1